VIPADKNAPAKKIEFPSSTTADNSSQFTYTCSLDAGLDNLAVEKTAMIKGIPRELVSDDILASTCTLDYDYKISNTRNPATNNFNRGAIKQYEQEMAAKETDYKKKKPEQMKKLLEESNIGQVVSYDDFTLVSEGRSHLQPVLNYKEKYTLSSLTSKAGKNLLISIPRLIGKHAQIGAEERASDHDLDIYYTRSFAWTINFTVPAGYTVDAIASLNTKVDNATGAFITTAKMEGNKLVITASKVYKQKSIEKENWTNALEFLDAAYNFSQKKIVLRK
jgi:hypothetical protein